MPPKPKCPLNSTFHPECPLNYKFGNSFLTNGKYEHNIVINLVERRSTKATLLLVQSSMADYKIYSSIQMLPPAQHLNTKLRYLTFLLTYKPDLRRNQKSFLAANRRFWTLKGFYRTSVGSKNGRRALKQHQTSFYEGRNKIWKILVASKFWVKPLAKGCI